jgi:hypothetical protein
MSVRKEAGKGFAQQEEPAAEEEVRGRPCSALHLAGQIPARLTYPTLFLGTRRVRPKAVWSAG